MARKLIHILATSILRYVHCQWEKLSSNFGIWVEKTQNTASIDTEKF